SHLLIRLSPLSTLFPYTTLFRSHRRFERRLGARAHPRRLAGSRSAARRETGLAGFRRERKRKRRRPAFGAAFALRALRAAAGYRDRKSTRLNSSHVAISYAVFCL